jgi:hypothetical protein
MILSKCAELLKATVIVPAGNLDLDVVVACGSDLMSDVMAFSCATNQMLLTGLVNPQTIRTAEMMDVRAIVFVRGKTPDQMMCDLAAEKGIALLSTPLPMFTSCGLLHEAGVRGKGE